MLGRSAQAASIVGVAGLGLCWLLFGCGPDRRGGPSSRNSSQRSQPAASASAGDCYNPFLPATPDETLEYESTFSNNLPPYSYSATFSEVSDGTFVQHQELTGGVAPAPYDNALDRTFRCQPEGLVSAVY